MLDYDSYSNEFVLIAFRIQIIEKGGSWKEVIKRV